MSEDVFRLSLYGGSGNSIQTLLYCPQKHILERRWRRRKKHLWQAEGALFHFNTERILKGLMKFDPENEEDPQIVRIQKVFEEGKWVDPQTEREIEFDTTELAYPPDKKTGKQSEITKAQQAAKRVPHMLGKVAEVYAAGHFGKIAEVEKRLQVDVLIDPDTGKPDEEAGMIRDEGIAFSGRIDLLCEDERGEGIRDFKSVAPSGKGNLDAKTTEQLSIYGYLQTIDTGSLVKYVGLDAFTKHVTKCEHIFLPSDRTREDYRETFRLLKFAGRTLIRCRKEGFQKEGKIRHECRNTYNQLCDYFPLCFPQRYGKEELIEALSHLVRID